MYTYICIRTCLPTYIHTHTHTHTYIYKYMLTYTSVMEDVDLSSAGFHYFSFGSLKNLSEASFIDHVSDIAHVKRLKTQC